LRAGVGSKPYLLVGETGVLAGVLVGQVERVAGELDTIALDQVGVVVACGLQIESAFLILQKQHYYTLEYLVFCPPIAQPHAHDTAFPCPKIPSLSPAFPGQFPPR
jgi:hypothetical protein